MDNNANGYANITFGGLVAEAEHHSNNNIDITKCNADVQIYNDRGKLSHDLKNIKISELVNYGIPKETLTDLKIKQKTFAFPSHSIMPMLITLFAGKQIKISKKLFELPYEQLDEKHKQEFDKINKDTFTRTKRDVKYDKINDKDVIIETKYAVICENNKVYSEAQITHDSIFSKDSNLALYLKKIFGIEGLRHFLAFTVALDENYRCGEFIWTLNKHMKRLGYKPGEKAFYNKQTRSMASEVVRVLGNIALLARSTTNKGKNILSGESLFWIRSFKEEWVNKKVLEDVEMKIMANQTWYGKAFEPIGETTPQYTKLLKSVVKEDHRLHPFTLYLTPLFSIFWRMNTEKKITLKNLFEWCDIDHTSKNRNRARDLKALEDELNYMKERSYLGDWFYNAPFSEKKPFDNVIILTAPQWLNEEITAIKSRQETIVIKRKRKFKKVLPNKNLMTVEDLKFIMKKHNLNASQVAKKIGVSRQLMSAILNGKRKVNESVSNLLNIRFN